MLDFFFARDALDLARFYADVEGSIRALVAPAQDPEAMAVLIQGGEADHEHRMIQGPGGERVLRLVAFERDVRGALSRCSEYFQMVLACCYRDPLRSAGVGKHTLLVRSAFGIDREALCRHAEPLTAYGRTTVVVPRGAGNIAHLVPVLIAAHAGERTRLSMEAWTDRLALKFQRALASPEESAWCHEAKEQCKDLRNKALGKFHEQRRRLPAAVRRAGLLHSA